MKSFATVAELAKMIDHSLLSPILTDAELREGCELAKARGCASVCVKPCHVKMAKELLKGSGVLVCSVAAFPHGNSSIAIKALESKQAIDDGAEEIDLVVNLGKAVQGDWAYVEEELRAVLAVTKSSRAALKVIFENDLLPDDKTKIALCGICSKLAVDFVKTSTGYNYVKGPDGRYSYRGATESDLKLMRANSAPSVQVKAAGGVRNLASLLRARELGATRVGASATREILDEAARAADANGRIDVGSILAGPHGGDASSKSGAGY